MQIQPFRRLAIEDYPTAPAWFQNFMSNINPMIDQLNQLLAGRVDIDNNLQAERQTITVTHGVPFNIRMARLTQTPFLVRVGYAAGHVGHAGITAFNADGTVQVTVYFQDAPTAAVSTTLIFEP